MKVVELSGQVRIQDLSHDGRGIARVDGKIVFVEGALPNEEVRFEYLKKRKDYDEAIVHEVIQASPERVTPACPHFGVCGGCSLQHLSPKGQLKYKQQHWLHLMQKMGGGLPDETITPIQTEVWNYRRKARLGVKYVAKKNKVLLGFREKRNPQYLMDMEECLILHSQFSKHLPELKHLLNQLPSAKSIAQIELAVGEECALVFRNLAPLSAEDEYLIEEFAKASQYKIYLQPKGPDSLQLFYPKDANFSMSFKIPEFDVSITFEPLDFIQVNQRMNEAMIRQALDLLEVKSDDRVLDLFCGLGNFTLPLAKRAAYVYGVEGYAPMIARAQQNAKVQGIENIEFLVADLQDPEASKQLEAFHFNKILLDPPRDGAQAVVEAMGQLCPERIVYVSCHPATLARDAEILRKQFGYRMIKGGVMDMFPHTNHIESMALFVKDNNGQGERTL